MRVVSGFDSRKCEQIARMCGNKSARDAVAYLRRAHYNNRESFVCELFDDVAFYAGSVGKDHFRLYEMAVKEEYRGKGYGKAMLVRIKKICKEKGVSKITLRTSREDGAAGFYRKGGAIVVGRKGEDIEMEIAI